MVLHVTRLPEGTGIPAITNQRVVAQIPVAGSERITVREFCYGDVAECPERASPSVSATGE